MAPRRWWLPVLAVGSLVVLVYAGVFSAFSVPVTEAMAEKARLPGEATPRPGMRALVVPLASPTALPESENGTRLLVADEQPVFPTNARNASIVLVLAYVAPTANGSYVPATMDVNVTFAEGDGVNRTNVTLDVADLAQGKKGYLVRAPAEPDVFFVETDRVVGHVARYEPGGALVAMYALGGVGFVLPLAALVLTHRASGRPGVPGGKPFGGGGGAACPECRTPRTPGLDFCARCGAWLGKHS